MRIATWGTLGLALVIAGCTAQPPVQPAEVPNPISVPTAEPPTSEADVAQEVARLRASLLREVPQHTVDGGAQDGLWIDRAKAIVNVQHFIIDRAQLLVVVDRNPTIQQQLRIVLAQPNAPWLIVGGSKVSTGQAGRQGYFITPIGVFLHTTGILDYRALGTFNENHIRGLGLKGMRVWDLGWQTAERGWRHDRDSAEIRLEMHATDPDYLEQRLGRPASEGCVRIPATMNRFLDVHGVLDADYERAAPDDARIRAVLLPARQPTPLAGNVLVVVDSSQAS
jgi:hypothetical protein